MPGIDVTDPRLLAIQQATRGMDPQQAAGYLQKVADSGAVPGSLAYLMSMYQKVKALEGMTPPSQGPAGPMPTVKDQLEAKLGSGIASVPAPNLARPDTFAGGGIVAFADSGYVAGGASSSSRYYGNDGNEYIRRGMEGLYENVEDSPKNVEYALTRQNLEARKRQRDITKEEKNYLDSQIKQLDNERKRAKGEFFVEAGANLASSNRPFIGALASSFKDPAGKYASGIRGLMDKEMAIKKESIAADLRDAGYDVEDADRMAAAEVADQTARTAARGELGKAQVNAGLELNKLKMEQARIGAILEEARMRRDSTPWMSYKPLIEKALAKWQNAIEQARSNPTDPKLADAIDAAKLEYDDIVASFQQTQPSIVAGQNRDATTLIGKGVDKYTKAAPRLDAFISRYPAASTDEERVQIRERIAGILEQEGLDSSPANVDLLIRSGKTLRYIQQGGAAGAGAGADIQAPTLVPDDLETEARFGLGPP